MVVIRKFERVNA